MEIIISKSLKKKILQNFPHRYLQKCVKGINETLFKRSITPENEILNKIDLLDHERMFNVCFNLKNLKLKVSLNHSNYHLGNFI